MKDGIEWNAPVCEWCDGGCLAMGKGKGKELYLSV